MYCRKSSTFPLIISDIQRQILRNCLRFAYFLVNVHVKTHFWAFLRTLESISDLVWSICSSVIHWVTAWRSDPTRSISCGILCFYINIFMRNVQERYYGISVFQLAVLFLAFRTDELITFLFSSDCFYISEQKKWNDSSSLIFPSLLCAQAAVFINIMLLFQ